MNGLVDHDKPEEPLSPLAVPGGEEHRLTSRVWRTGHGSLLTDIDGRDHIDLGAGTLTQSLGHCHPQVVASVQAQAAQLENVHDSPTPIRDRAAHALRRLLPGYLERVAFFSTGAEVVEAALRMAYAVSSHPRRRVVALRHGFHGKTRGARSLVQWDVGTEPPAASVLGYAAYCYRCPFRLTYPSCNLLCARLTVEQALAKPDVAAFIAEPVQGAAGVIVPPPGYWEILFDACHRHGVLLIADEVLTGGGRTGTFLASEQFGIEPDLVTLAKGIGSGYPVAALTGRDRILNSDTCNAAGGFSSTFGGALVGLAAAAATLETIEHDHVLARVRQTTDVLRAALAPITVEPSVGEVRQIGLLAAVEFVRDRQTREPAAAFTQRVVARASERGVRVLPGENIIRIAPSFLVDEATLGHAINQLLESIRDTYAEP